MQPLVSSHTSWQPLEEVIVGRTYSPDYFDFIQDATVRNQLQHILSETEEDLDNLQRVIEQYGACVRRPTLPNKQTFQTNQINECGVAVPPLTPRDWQITLGEKLLRIIPSPALNDICTYYGDAVINPHGKHWSPDCILNGASASCIVRVGRDIFFDNSEFLQPEQSQWIIDNVLDPNYRIHTAVTDGHGDAVFAILKPGVILSSKHDKNLDLETEFPGWEILRIMDSSIDAAMAVGKFRYENFNGRWYVQGQNSTDEFRRYVDTYLTQWVGYVKETVFDVNCLVLDESHVIFSAYNKNVFEFCRRHHIEPIISELRHSYFWDGGISCCTQDIRRRGNLETYL
jgi:hypothetical protein